MREQGGKNYELAFDSLNPMSAKFKKPTEQEYDEALVLLEGSPEAVAIAKAKVKS